MKLAKDALDVGLLTDDEAMIEFFAQEVGLGEPELLRITRGVDQHRFDMMGSVIKVNVVAELQTEARSGYSAIVLADERLGAPRKLRGPDGVAVEIARPSAGGVEQLGVHLEVPDRSEAERYFSETLGWEVAGGQVRAGRTRLLLSERADAPSAVRFPVRGWTYLTVQIFDCDQVTREIVARGAELAAPAKTMGDVARFSVVADRWGNQLEISERASVTGRPVSQG